MQEADFASGNNIKSTCFNLQVGISTFESDEQSGKWHITTTQKKFHLRGVCFGVRVTFCLGWSGMMIKTRQIGFLSVFRYKD